MRFQILRIFLGIGLCASIAAPIVQAAPDPQTKRDLETLKSNQDNLGSQLADAMNQLLTLRQDIAPLKNFIESANHTAEEQNKKLQEYDQRITAIEDKLTTLSNLLQEIRQNQTGLSSPTSQPAETRPVSSTPQPTTQPASTNASQTLEYQKILDLIHKADYNTALSELLIFAKKNPTSAVADQVQYWIGECYYALNDYKKAILEFQNLIQRYPNSNKVRPALLKQGLSFFGLKLYAEARPFFEKVTKQYAGTPEAERAAQKLKEIVRFTNPPQNH